MARDKTDTTPGATSATWGLPDWRDAVAYSNYSEWDLDRWHWEFLRRRNDYRRDYMTAHQIQVASGFIQANGNEQFFNSDDAIKYGLLFFYDPAIGHWGADGPSWYDPQLMLSGPLDGTDRWWQFKTLTFDLSKPIVPQLEPPASVVRERPRLDLCCRSASIIAVFRPLLGCA
jgi:hypothetical protein